MKSAVFWMLLLSIQIYSLLSRHHPSHKRVAATDRISSIPQDVQDKLSYLLDVKSSDWKRLTKELNLSSLIPILKDDKNMPPTLLLLQYLDVSQSVCCYRPLLSVTLSYRRGKPILT